MDLDYAQRDDFDTPPEETMEAFDRLIKSGKIRAMGVSNLKGWRIAEANMVSQLKGWSGYCAVEQRYTYLRPRHGADFGPQICVDEDLKSYWFFLFSIAPYLLNVGKQLDKNLLSSTYNIINVSLIQFYLFL